MGFHAIGRGTEVGLSSWPSAYWCDIEKCMFINWMELKVSQQKMMSFFPDALSYECCFFHSLFCYFSSGKGTTVVTTDMVHHIFPNLSENEAKNACVILTVYLRSVVGHVEGLDVDASSKDLRYGPANTIYIHPDGGCEIAGARGGWGLDVISTGYQTGAMTNYLTCLSVLICKAGRILAGYKNCAYVYTPPRCHFITADNQVRIFNFLSSVLHLQKRHPKFNPENGSMKTVTLLSFACYLMWLEKVIYIIV